MDIDLLVAGGSVMRAYEAGPPTGPPVIVAHELFGVNPDIRSFVDALAQAGHRAIAPEFYHRWSPAGHWLARDDAGRTEGFSLLHRIDRQTALLDVDACLTYLGPHAALVGFSAGGHLAYFAACSRPIRRTAVLYGGWLSSTDIPLSRPEPTLSLTPGISGELLYLVGDADHMIDADEVARIRAALADRGEVVTLPGAAHAFFWPDTPSYDANARDEAWKRLLAFLA